MVSVSGFRGVVGETLTPELVTGITAAYASFLQSEGETGPVFIGRDSRTSGPMFARAAAAGVLSVGMDVVDLGIVSTPTLLLATREARGAGALGVTASHNPAQWNALKFAGSDGVFLDPPRMERFLASVREDEPRRAQWDAVGQWREDGEAGERHLDRILDLPHLDVSAIRDRGFIVALDCVRGAGFRIMPALLDRLGCTVVGIGLEGDGRFPRDPEPTAENLKDLSELVRAGGADLGLAVDPDVDRLSLVDGDGVPLGEDLTLAVAAAAVLRRTPGPVVTNLSTSRIVEDVAEEAGVLLHRAPVGEVNVARRMEEVGAVVGGEGNGGVILPELHLTRDAPLAAALVLQHLVDEGKGMREAVSRWPTYHILKQKVPRSSGAVDAGYESLASAFGAPDVDRQDGLRLSWPEERKWLHVRPSGTEPVVRLIAEATTQREARSLLQRARDILGHSADGSES